MPPEQHETKFQLEIGHVLFIDIVGYSKALIDDQRALQQDLNDVVRNTEQFRVAESAGKLIRLPTGDGMALVFFTSPEAPLQCAMQIADALKSHPRLRLRMGINTGPVIGEVEVKHGVRIAIVNFYTDTVGNPELSSKLRAAQKKWTRGRIALLGAAG